MPINVRIWDFGFTSICVFNVGEREFDSLYCMCSANEVEGFWLAWESDGHIGGIDSLWG